MADMAVAWVLLELGGAALFLLLGHRAIFEAAQDDRKRDGPAGPLEASGLARVFGLQFNLCGGHSQLR